VQSAFFSTGNVASVSSFSLDSVYRLVPVFNPFSQGALLVAKILAPFALVSANLGVLDRRLGVAPSALFMLVAALSDGLTLAFFFRVRDAGSWLDIGTSISHFVIASLLGVFVAALQAVSELLARGLVDIGDDGGRGDAHAHGHDQGVRQPNSGEGREQPSSLSDQKNLPSSSSLPSPHHSLPDQQQQQQPLPRGKDYAINGSAEN
jgi:phosphatidylinositol glycan class N